MAEIPTLQEEDAKRPTREREGLVRERTRLVNRIKGALARLGIRGFKPTLRQAPEPSARAPECSAASGRGAPPAQYPGRAAARHGALALCPGPDPGDRSGASGPA